MKKLLAAVLLATTACASDRRTVQDAAAFYTWAEWKYERDCLGDYAPVRCKERYEALKQLKAITTIANEVEKVGKLPPDAKKTLKEAQAAVK